MAWFRLRPTFEIGLRERREEAIERIFSEYQRRQSDTLMFVHGEYGEFHLPKEEHRLWSPHLSFYVHDDRGHGLIRGRFAPRLEIWTFVWVVYLALAFSCFFGLTLGYSQWTLGGSVWGLWIALVSLLAIIGLYVVAHVGQQWSSDQMVFLRTRLHQFLEQAGVAVIDR